MSPTSEVVARLDEIADGATGASWIQDAARDAAALISSLVAEREQQPQFDGLPKRKLDGLLASGWQISGYAIHKDGEHGLVTTGGFVGWFTSAQERALTAERLLAEAVEQAFRDGLAYGGNVENADPDVAWKHSKARATLSTGGVNG